MKFTPALFGMILLEILILVAIAGVIAPQAVFGEHMEDMPDIYVYHPTDRWFNERHEIHIIEVWVQKEQNYIPKAGKNKCAPDYELDLKGACTLAKYHYWVYSLYLISEMPGGCSNRAAGCILENGIYILNGATGGIPEEGGCSLLWHEILHLKWGWMDGMLHHDRMAEEFPNSECALVEIKHEVQPEPYFFTMPIYVIYENGYKIVQLTIVDDEEQLPDLERKMCGLSFAGCAISGQIYMTGNSGEILWHEIRHQTGDHPHFP